MHEEQCFSLTAAALGTLTTGIHTTSNISVPNVVEISAKGLSGRFESDDTRTSLPGAASCDEEPLPTTFAAPPTFGDFCILLPF